MSPDDVRERLARIRADVDDDESAHYEEDKLHEDVLRAIAEGTAVDGATCARLALTTSEIKFSRWYA